MAGSESSARDAEGARRGVEPWRILIADDEDEVHVVTRLVLRDLSFEERPVEFLSARSAAEARKVFESGVDIAVVLLDVVMESDHAGLEVVRHVRGTLKNRYTRIILRTGQPGSAPERSVIAEYDINDYKEKTELSSVKLYSCVMSALRSYRDITAIDRAKRGLERIISSSSALFRTETSVSEFASAVLGELDALLETSRSFFFVRREGFAAVGTGGGAEIVSGTEAFRSYLHRTIDEIADPAVHALVERAMRERASLFLENEFVGFFASSLGFESVLYMRADETLGELDRNLLQVFSTNIALAFDNLVLTKDIVDTQKEIVYTMGDVVETRSRETANHVKRVSELALALAGLAGLSPEEQRTLYSAAPLHDVGKIGIADGTMLKPGSLDPGEWEEMKRHTVIGHEILKHSKREILRAACTIAHEHHERWDGKGYPQGLAGEAIHVFARIVAIVDVFDALLHRRAYKEAWLPAEVRDYIREGAGSQFDPRLAGLLLERFDDFLAITERYPDKPAPPGEAGGESA